MLTRDSMEANVFNADQVRKRDRGKEIRKNSEKVHISWDLMNYKESRAFILNMKARQWRDLNRSVRNQIYIF